MRIQARAKINWTLDIVGKREDGYHLMDMLMQPVELADDVTIELAEELSLTTSGYPLLKAGPDNLTLRAATLLKAHTGYPGGAKLHLHNRIPVGAGMGGGSADAAAVLVGLNRLWNTGLAQADLEALGLKLGADVPFCLRGGLQRTQGVGERMTPLPCGSLFPLVALQPCPGLSTREIFGRFRLDAREDRPDTEAAMAALANGDLPGLCGSLGNVLQSVSEALCPEIGEGIAALKAVGAVGARMTGSGSAVFGVFENEQTACAAQEKLVKRWRSCFVTHTCQESLVVEE